MRERMGLRHEPPPRRREANRVRLWSMQTVSRTDFDAGETYLTLMQRNYEALKGGLL